MMNVELLVNITLGVIKVLLPLIFLFLLAQKLFLKLPGDYVLTIIKGICLSFLGLVLFLYGVHFGFLPMGTIIGEKLGAVQDRWLLIPFGFVIGFLAAFSEPQVRVLSDQVEEYFSGYIGKRLVLYAISVGVAFFVALGMAKIVYGIPILYIIVPGYTVALIMMWFSDSRFVAIAFDAGGVATGPMAVTFLMAIAVGIATAMEGRDPIIDGFGLIALIALAPIISLMVIGVIYRRYSAVILEGLEEVKHDGTGDK